MSTPHLFRRSFRTLAAVLVLTAAVCAQTPNRIAVQGLLTDVAGEPLPDGAHTLTFKLYLAGTSEILWMDTRPVATAHGIYDVVLGPFGDMAFDVPIELGVTVGSGPELSPRTPLASAPYALAVRGLRVLPAPPPHGPNFLSGHEQNYVDEGVKGATISGGGYLDAGEYWPNRVHADYATIGGGRNNDVAGFGAMIGGGTANIASGERSVVAGGHRNEALAPYATIAGGAPDWVQPEIGNSVFDRYGTVGGGARNHAGRDDGNVETSDFATVAGGWWNRAEGSRSTIGGGYNNQVDAEAGTIAGGATNQITGQYGTIGGGSDNIAAGDPVIHGWATVGGGRYNYALHDYSFVGGGTANAGSGSRSTIGGGSYNKASGLASVVPGGSWNRAAGEYSLAAGVGAVAQHDGTFVWNDGFASTIDSLKSTGANQFLIRASGGVGIGTNSPGAQLAVSSGNTWTTPQVRVEQTNSTDYARLRMSSLSAVKYWDIAVRNDPVDVFNIHHSDHGNLLSITPAGATLTGHLTPFADNTYTLGSGSLRWKEVWAVDGTINTSDLRLKSHVRPLAYGLSEILRLEPVSYEWKGSPASGRRIGLIAQDVELVVPEVVVHPPDEETALGARYSELIPVLIKAIQEQQALIKSLQERLDAAGL